MKNLFLENIFIFKLAHFSNFQISISFHQFTNFLFFPVFSKDKIRREKRINHAQKVEFPKVRFPRIDLCLKNVSKESYFMDVRRIKNKLTKTSEPKAVNIETFNLFHPFFSLFVYAIFLSFTGSIFLIFLFVFLH